MPQFPDGWNGYGYMFRIEDPLEPRSTGVIDKITAEMIDLKWENSFELGNTFKGWNDRPWTRSE